MPTLGLVISLVWKSRVPDLTLQETELEIRIQDCLSLKHVPWGWHCCIVGITIFEASILYGHQSVSQLPPFRPRSLLMVWEKQRRITQVILPIR